KYREIESQVRLFRYGCDSYAYALLAAGHIYLVVENNLKPYDLGGIIPVIEGAGCIITTWDGGRPENGGGSALQDGDCLFVDCPAAGR
ncbi:inositol monophosphatase family protein, partial [Rhizobium johnstonii]|uniref:inositol monophosphatase family protein n=1 Tax=Rhizobium johnstonii TaxID=3019933 RepID=UPI003F94C965